MMRAVVLIGLEYLGIIEFDDYPFDEETVERAMQILHSLGRLLLMGVVILVEMKVAAFFGL